MSSDIEPIWKQKVLSVSEGSAMVVKYDVSA